MLQSVATDITSLTGSVAGGVVAPIAGTAIAGTGAMSAATATALVGGGVALVTLAVVAFLNRKGPKQKVATTQMVEELIPLLQRNRDEYLAGPRTPESYALALDNFDKGWQWLTSAAACGSPEMGNPGRACIDDRKRGGRYDMWKDLRDPIEQNPPLQSAPGSIDTAPMLTALQGSASDFSPSLLLGIGLIAAAVVFS